MILFLDLKGPQNPFLCDSLNILVFHPNTVSPGDKLAVELQDLLVEQLEPLSAMLEVSGHEELASCHYCAVPFPDADNGSIAGNLGCVSPNVSYSARRSGSSHSQQLLSHYTLYQLVTTMIRFSSGLSFHFHKDLPGVFRVD